MGSKRRIHLSVYYGIKNLLVRDGYVAPKAGDPLTKISSLVYRASEDDWVYQDLNKYPVKVYDNGSLIDESYYYRDFREGKITFTDYTPQGAITADYYYHQINMRRSYPDKETFTENDLPLIVVHYRGVPYEPFALGAQIERADHRFTIDIFAKSQGQMQDLAETIENWLLETPNLGEMAFSSGFPLLDNGEINPDFDDSTILEYHKQDINGVPFIAEGLTKMERYRYAIDFTLTSFKNYQRN